MPHPRDCAVHFTTLRYMSQSPAHYRARCESPFEPTPAMRFGTLVHMLCFEQPGVQVWQGDRRGKAWEQFRDAHEGDFIVTADEHARAMRCVESLRANPHASMALRGRYEVPVDWSWLGRSCSSRIDTVGDGFITELKTSNTTQPDRFRGACLGRLAYHAQLGFYAMAAEHIGSKPREAYIVGVETSAPYAVTVFRLTPRALEMGQRMCRVWMEQLLACEASDEWPSYTQALLDLDLPDDDEFKLIIDGEEVEAA